jgi:hypothetical protein
VKSPFGSVLALVGTVLLGWPLAAEAGILLVERTTVTNGPIQTHNIMIDKDAMRVEHDMPSGEKATFLFDGAQQVIRIVNADKKVYTEVTKADLDTATQQMTEAMARMQEQMKSMPPEQRARMEAMMKSSGMPGTAPLPKVTYKKVGTDTVGRWACDKYEGYQNGQKVMELCTVEPTALGFAPADFEVARKLAEFFKKLRPGGGDTMFSIGKIEDQGFSGVPVKRVFSSPQGQSVTEMTAASRQTFPKSTFEVPAGFQKQPLTGQPQ